MLEKFGYKQELKRSLSTWDLIVYGLVFIVPIAPMGIYGYVFQASNGMVVLAYILGLIGMVFTAYSYARMSEAFPTAGSVYAYAQRGISPSIGFLAGWMILLDYILIPALLYLVGANALAAIIPSIPAMAWVLLFIVINTVINIFGIEITAKANKMILYAVLAVLAIYIVYALIAIIQGVNGATFTFRPIYHSDGFSLSIIGTATTMAVLSFLGFDAISTLAEEAKDGIKSVGKATILSLVLVGAMFVVQTYLTAVIDPKGNFSNLDNAFYDIAAVIGGDFLKVLTSVATAISWGFASALAAQAAISRILYSMARDGSLPKILAKVHPKYKTPYVSTLLVGVISIIATNIFSTEKLTALVNFGAISSFLVLNLTVVVYYIVKKKSKKYISHLIMPLMGFAVIFYVWTKFDSLAIKLGGIWFVIGFIVLVISTKGFRKKNNLVDLEM